MKRLLTAVVLSVLLLRCFVIVSAAAATDNGSVWYAGVWDGIDDETARMLSEIGIQPDGSGNGLLELTPEKVFASLWSLFGLSLREPLRQFFAVLAVMLTVSLFSTLAGEGKTAEAAADIGTLVTVFIIIASDARLFADCRASIELTKDLMLSLIPVLTGIVAFAGQPTLALSFQTVVFAFAEGISVGFSGLLPAVSVAGTAISTASAVAPFAKYGGLCKALAKGVNTVAAFVSGIFVAVLSVRGVIAGAADTVTIRGLRFLIGGSVPVVGSAIGEALNSVTAGLGLIKNSILILGVLAVVVINVPGLLRAAVWSLLMYFAAVFADMLSLNRVSELIASVRSVLSVIIAVTCFNMFVYVISCAILVTVKN